MLVVERHRGKAGLLQALPLRRLVFIEQEGYMDTGSPFLEDEHDRAQNTFHVLIRRDAELAGAVRFTLDLGRGTAADKHFDFRPYLPAGAVVAAGGQLCIDRRHRGGCGVYTRMMSCFYFWLTSQGVTHVKGVINPVIASLFESAGYHFLSEPFQSPHSNLPCIAVLLDMDDLPVTSKEFTARHSRRHEEESSCRIFMAENENLSSTDCAGLHSIFVVSGRANLRKTEGSNAVTDSVQLDLNHSASALDSTWSLQAITEFEAVAFTKRVIPS